MKHQDKSLSYSNIAAQMNEKYDIQGGRKLSKSTLQRYVAEKKIGVSPDKRGPSPTRPGEFWELLVKKLCNFKSSWVPLLVFIIGTDYN